MPTDHRLARGEASLGAHRAATVSAAPRTALPALLLGFMLSACMPHHAVPLVKLSAEPSPGRAVYDTDVRIDPDSGEITARAILSYVAEESTASEVGLLLNRGLTVESVRGLAVRAFDLAPFDRVPAWNLLRVALTQVLPGTPVTLEITYSGKPLFPSKNGNGISREAVELNLDSQWHPVFAAFDQEMVGVLRVELPSTWSVVGSGAASIENGVHVLRNTVPQVDVALFGSTSFERMGTGSVTVHYLAEHVWDAAALVYAVESCRSYLNAQFGTGNPLPVVTLVLAGPSGSVYARKNYIVMGASLPESPAQLHQQVCHELTHYWTRTDGPLTSHYWMMEAFAEYGAAVYLRDRFGEAEFERILSHWRAASVRTGPVWTPTLRERPSGESLYRRAPFLLHRLEMKIGRETFDTFLAAYMAEGITTTSKLLDRLDEIAGPGTADWFQAELASKGVLPRMPGAPTLEDTGAASDHSEPSNGTPFPVSCPPESSTGCAGPGR